MFIDKENTGVSNTRNLGIELSKGKYLFFIDSDDELNTEEFIDIYKFVVESNFDLICFNSKTIINSKISKNFIFKKSSILGGGVVWAKFFKREFILKNNLRFNPNLKYSEDSVFMSDFNKFFPKSINFEDLCIYYYRISNDHTMTRYNINAFDDFNKTFIELKKNMSINELTVIAFCQLYEYILKISFYNHKCKLENKKNKIIKTLNDENYIYKELFENLKNVKLSKYGNIQRLLFRMKFYKLMVILDNIKKYIKK